LPKFEALDVKLTSPRMTAMTDLHAIHASHDLMLGQTAVWPSTRFKLTVTVTEMAK